MDKIVKIAKEDLLTNKNKIKAKPNQFVGTSKGILSICVTPILFSRALDYMDLLISELKAKGHQIIHKDHRGTIVVIEGIELPIRLREKCRRVQIDKRKWSTSELEPIGTLVFTVDSIPRKEWEDSKNKSLELKIPNIIGYLEQRAQRRIELEREWARQKKVRDAQKQVEAEIREKQELEERKLEKLLDDCERWHRAKRLHEFISAVESTTLKDDIRISSELKSWTIWARNRADEIDPLFNILCIVSDPMKNNTTAKNINEKLSKKHEKFK